MRHIHKLTLFATLLLLCSFLVAGCTGAPKFTEEELREMLTESIQETASVDTVTLDMDMSMSANITGEESGAFVIGVSAEGAMDLAAEEMEMLMDMEMKADIEGVDIGMDDILMEMYKVDGWAYVHMKMPGFGDEWVKSRVIDADLDSFSPDMVMEQFDVLEAASSIEYVREEEVGDSNCYLLKVNISLDKFLETMGKQTIPGMPLDWDEIMESEEFGALMDSLKNVYYNVWIDKDTNYIRKMTAEVEMNISSDMFGEPGVGMMEIDVAMDYVLDNFNKPVNIVLPEEALNAEEGSMGSFPFQ